MADPGRISQQFVEVVTESQLPGRVSQQFVEVVTDLALPGRVSQQFVEVVTEAPMFVEWIMAAVDRMDLRTLPPRDHWRAVGTSAPTHHEGEH